MAALVAGALLLPTPAAHAQASGAASPPATTDDTARERALDLADEGERAYREGRLTEAAELLRRAYQAFPSAVLLYNLARIEESAGHELDAAELYERYLREDPSAESRGSIEKRIATLRARDAERRQARVERDQALRRAREAEARARAERPLVPIAVPWTIFAAGAAATGVGVALGLAARGEEDAAADDATQVGALEHFDRAEGLATAANVTLVAGGVLAAGGLVWLLVRAGTPSAAEPAPLAVGCEPAGLRGRGTF
jgi:tetratricopeptide (TPR) repeat protein